MLRPDLVSVSSSVIELLGSFVFRSGGEDSEENNDHSPEARPLEEVAKSRLVSNGVDQSIATVLTLWRLASKIRSLSRMCLPSHTHAQVVRGGRRLCNLSFPRCSLGSAGVLFQYSQTEQPLNHLSLPSLTSLWCRPRLRTLSQQLSQGGSPLLIRT
jgi:hypothetical protein